MSFAQSHSVRFLALTAVIAHRAAEAWPVVPSAPVESIQILADHGEQPPKMGRVSPISATFSTSSPGDRPEPCLKRPAGEALLWGSRCQHGLKGGAIQ